MAPCRSVPLLRASITEIARIARFGLIGTLSALAYAAVTSVLVRSGLAGPVPAAVIGYAMAGTISYLGHIYYSFGVEPDHRRFLWRFVLTVGVTLPMTIGCTWLITVMLGYPNYVSIVAVTILIPGTNYICNRFWVFRQLPRSR
jgi:putative flippase GtrA